jgi:hypothetical protein
MAYDRYDTRNDPRDERSRWRDEGSRDRSRGGPEERGFFERAGDEIASWFGDDDAERRRREDEMRMERERGQGRGWRSDDERRGDFRRDRDWDRGREYGERGRFFGSDRERERNRDRFDRDEDHGPLSTSSYRGHGGQGSWRGSMWGTEAAGEPGAEGRYRPMMGGYTYSDGLDSRSRNDEFRGRDDEFRRRRREGEESGGHRSHDPQYHAWRRRQMDELDRDYDEYRRENQQRFESEFGSWRERRQQKRGILGQVREHMDVVGNDGQHVGTVDRTAGDRLILTKSDPESGGVHHSLSCADIDRIEGDQVILDCSAEQAKQRWRDENRSRALFEREDQGEMGDRILDRSFEGTYR